MISAVTSGVVSRPRERSRNLRMHLFDADGLHANIVLAGRLGDY